MKSVSIIIILCTVPAGLGVIIDRLMLNRHKGRLHDALLRYWNHLDDDHQTHPHTDRCRVSKIRPQQQTN